MTEWGIFKGTREPHDGIEQLPPAPEWRSFSGEVLAERQFAPEIMTGQRRGEKPRGATFEAGAQEIDLVNAALFLRRPLLVTGKPGCGKSSLAYAVAHELGLGPVLVWPINTRSTLQDGLYRYDAIARLQDAQLNEGVTPDIGQYIRLGPVGTALLAAERPRVLLIDEIDKSDIDLPNDLLNIFEEGEFAIPELTRLADARRPAEVTPWDGEDRVPIRGGRVRCRAFPFVVLTSNGEREFPPAFLRRCLRLNIMPPNKDKLIKIVELHLGQEAVTKAEKLIEHFVALRDSSKDLSTDQLLNAIYFVTRGINPLALDRRSLIEALLRQLTNEETQ